MLDEFIKYLFGELKDHLEKLKDEAYSESPNEDRADYHFDKATEIITKLEKGPLNVQ
jgi:flagellin-specific chaperone FliS